VSSNTLYAITDTITTDAPINDATDHRGGNKEISHRQMFADTVHIGTYTITPTSKRLTYMTYKDLAPDPVLEEREKVDVDKYYLYSKGPLLFRLGYIGQAPGDKRISYRAVESNQTATLVGVPARTHSTSS
jgi:hypothetical protein